MDSARVQSIFDIIREEPVEFVNSLYDSYESHMVQKSIFHNLSALAKVYVMRLIFMSDSNFTKDDLNVWISTEHERRNDYVLDELVSHKIIHSIEGGEFGMNKFFSTAMKNALCNASDPWENTVQLKPDKSPPTLQDIEQFYTQKWENLLRYLITAKVNSSVNSTSCNFLLTCGLHQLVNSKLTHITSAGYEYLFRDQQTQAWIFVSEYLRHTVDDTAKKEIMILVFSLANCIVGRCYPVQALSIKQKDLVKKLYDLGIIYMKDLSSSRFYPTNIAVNMIFRSTISQSKAGNPLNKPDLKIIVETNFQVCAYVNSELQLDMLKLFVDVTVRMPNMVIGNITRNKAKTAYSMGIRASQIIDFLQSHAHPLVRENENIVPENVVDQLTIWATERERLCEFDAHVLDFSDIPDCKMFDDGFHVLVNFAKANQILLWENKAFKLIAVKTSNSDPILDIMKGLFN